MAKTQQNATMWQNEDKSLVFTVTGTTLTTATAIKWELSVTNRTANLVSKTLGSGITADSATQCTVALDATDTTSLIGDYYHELRVTNATGSEEVVSAGTITIKISTTKS